MPWLIDQDEPVIGEDEKIAENLEGAADGLAGYEDGRELGLNFGVVDFGGIAKEIAE